MDIIQKKRLLIKDLIHHRYLKSQNIINVFEKVPRESFVPKRYYSQAYTDEPLPIGEGQTISAPHMVAIMTELLEPKKTDKVLEIGTGSGYQAAMLSWLVKKVVTMERIEKLATESQEKFKRLGYKNIEVIVGDGSKGYIEGAPYDKIIVTCGAKDIPNELVKQLRLNGRIVIPVGSWQQDLILGIKTKDGLKKRSVGGCIFVPLKH